MVLNANMLKGQQQKKFKQSKRKKIQPVKTQKTFKWSKGKEGLANSS